MASGTIKAVVPKSDIVDNLTTNDSTKVLSAAQGYALNSKFTTHNVYGTESVDVPSNARDLTVFVRLGTSGGLQNLVFTFSLPLINADTTGLTLTQGYYLTASTYGFCQITASANNKITIVSLNIGGTEYKTTSQVTVFYKV